LESFHVNWAGAIADALNESLLPEGMQVLGHKEALGILAETVLCGVAYRPVVRDGQEQIEIWPSPLNVGQPLPTLPLALNAEIAVPIDLEATYTIACHRRRLA
jgi:hypothetical protein